MVQNASYTLQSSDLHMHLWANILLSVWALVEKRESILFCITLRMLIFEPISQFFAMVMTRTHTDGDHSVSVQLQAPFQPVDLLGIPDSPSTLLTTLGLSTKLLTVSMLGSFMGYVSSKKAPLWMLMCMADLGPGENMGGFADPTLGCLLL